MNRKLRNEELKRISVEEYKKIDKIPVMVILDNIRSLNNVGAVFRTSDAFLIHGICLCGFTPQPPHREIHKTALGATESVDWKYYDRWNDAVTDVREEGWKIIAVEQAEGASRLEDFNPQPGERYALVFGNEIEGVDQELVNQADMCLEIPQYGTKHSLNIAVCVGVVLWELTRKIRN